MSTVAKAFTSNHVAPYCDDTAYKPLIAGSLRQRAPEVKNVDILCAPTPYTDARPTNLLQDHLLDLARGKDAQLTPRMSDRRYGRPRPLAWFSASHESMKISAWWRPPNAVCRYPIDLHIALFDYRPWYGYYKWLYTGPTGANRNMVRAEFSPAGLSLHDGIVWLEEQPIAVHDERDLFDLWRMEYVVPSKRTWANYIVARRDFEKAGKKPAPPVVVGDFVEAKQLTLF